MFLGMESLDEEGLRLHRKRITPNANFEALEVARRLGITVAVNIIADPDWDERQFAAVREWAMTVPEIVHLTVTTPYPGTEIWHTESRRLTSLDYRLFDVQHAVLPTRLPLPEFYRQLVTTQAVLNRKHLGVAALKKTASIAARLALRGQTNFLRMLWKFGGVYSAERQYADHQRPVTYTMRPPPPETARPRARDLFIHVPHRGQGSRPAEHLSPGSPSASSARPT
jgi:magnesium-protoporphyrin IX monomethyl ester (oxidative) cyclase